MPPARVKAWVAEAVGTFALVFSGVLSISAIHIVNPISGDISTNAPPLNTLTSLGLAYGLALAVMVAALGPVSGGHFNPAVTFGFVITGRTPVLTGVAYVAAQLAGAVAATLLITNLFNEAAVFDTTPDLGPHTSYKAGIALEAVATFFLVLVVFAGDVAGRGPRSVYALYTGLAVALGVMALWPLTGAALNPARAFGPAVASAHWTNHAVYWIGPLLGGGAAALLQHFFLMEPTPSSVAAEHGDSERESDSEE